MPVGCLCCCVVGKVSIALSSHRLVCVPEAVTAVQSLGIRYCLTPNVGDISYFGLVAVLKEAEVIEQNCIYDVLSNSHNFKRSNLFEISINISGM
jgi:hypothetical protein